MYLYYHGKLPDLFSSYLNPIKNVRSCETRSTTRKQYFVSSMITISAKQSLHSIEAKIWNDLQLEWKNYSYNKFKKLVKS